METLRQRFQYFVLLTYPFRLAVGSLCLLRSRIVQRNIHKTQKYKTSGT